MNMRKRRIRMSKGEEKISSLLKSAHIPYEKEYTFPDLTSLKISFTL